MQDILDTLVRVGVSEAWLVFAVFLRVGPATALAPGLGHSSVPMRARLLVGLVLSAAIVPIVRPMLPPVMPEPVAFALFAVKELVIGFFFGLFARGIMYLLEMAGAIISQTVTMAQMFPNNSEPISIMAHFLTVAGLALIFSTSILQNILWLFLLSYAFEVPTLADITGFMAERVADLLDFLFGKAVILASGFLGIFAVYYLFTGFLNKTMPQFMVIFVGVPFVALFSMEILRNNAELILTTWTEMTDRILRMPFEGVR